MTLFDSLTPSGQRIFCGAVVVVTAALVAGFVAVFLV